MLFSLALIFIFGLTFGYILERLKLPSLIGMLITGVILGPFALGLIDSSLLNISAELRQIALVVILTRAGLSLNIDDLRKVGRPAVLLCFVPACFEIFGMVLLAPKLLGITVLEAAIMGAVLGAVSPAVVVPRMLGLLESGYGVKEKIPQMLIAGASVDDVFVLVLFASFTGLAAEGGEGGFSVIELGSVPVSIVLGLIAGGAVGWGLSILFKKIHRRDSVKVLIILSVSFLLVSLEKAVSEWVPFSGLLAVLAVGLALLKFTPQVAVRLSNKFSKLWVASEILLFVLVGASVDIRYTLEAGIAVVLLIFCALCFRMIGVLVCMIKTPLNAKERCFCMFAYMPKATVQAAIGGVPLAMGLGCGKIVLTVAVVAIFLTAPLGALLIDFTYKKFLKSSKKLIIY